MTKLARRIAPALALLAAPLAPAAAQDDAVAAPPAPAAGCLHEREWTLAFTAEDAVDRATATTLGPDCESAVIVLVVRDDLGIPVYQDVWALGWFADNAGVLPEPEAVLAALRPRIAGFMADQPPAAQLETERQWLEAPPAYVDHLRDVGGAILCYETGHESGSCAAFDPEHGEGVRILSSGV